MAPPAGIVLAGGRSSRMGRPKGSLEWHGDTLLRRTVALLHRTVDGPVVVVASPGQELPPLPHDTEVVADPVEGLGPLQGLAVGLAAVADRASVAFACSTDLPFLHPAFVVRVLRALADPRPDVALPFARGYRQPLAAAYRTALAGSVAALVAAGRRAPGMLFENCEVTILDDAALLADAALARLDPALDSVAGVDTPEEYAAARARPAAEVTVRRVGAGAGRSGERTVRAATLAAAAERVGLVLDRHVVAALNGDRITPDRITPDPLLPLVAGDSIAFGRRDSC